MEKQKAINSIALAQTVGESSTFICTECGDGFTQYANLLAHMTIHGPLESFSFDGSSNGFEVPREYVLQENGTLTVVSAVTQSHYSAQPLSPGVLPPHLAPPVKPVLPTLRHEPSPFRDVFRPRPSDVTLDKSRQGHYRCEICSRSFNSLQSLHRHQQYRNTERGYKCTLCCKIFEARQTLKKHLQDHANERFYCCDQCGKRFLKVDSLSAHQKEIHFSLNDKASRKLKCKLEKSHLCKKCKQRFFWISDFHTHSLYHCKGKLPDITFGSEIEIEVTSKNIEDRPFENCNSNGTSIAENGDSKHLSDTSGKIDTDYSFTPYRCGLCGDSFQKLTALKEHHLTHQTQEEIDQLNQESQRTAKLKVSPRGRRRRGSNLNAKLHPCKHCHRVFNHSSSLSRHMRYHKGTMHTCVFCGRHFPQRCDMRKHVVVYHKAELEKKPALKLVYSSPQKEPTPNSLDGKKPSSRDEKTKGSFDNEQNTSPEEHTYGKQSGKTGRVNYKCQECGKRFGLLCVYQRHMRYHKKEPNKLPQCPDQFRNSSSLQLPLQNHPSAGEVEGVHTSHGCGTSGDLDLEKGHTKDLADDHVDHSQNGNDNSSEVLYECTECTETFSCLETFLQHQTSHGSECHP